MAANAVIGVGSQILAGAIIAPEARLDRHCIINTRASVDHECVLEDGVEAKYPPGWGPPANQLSLPPKGFNTQDLPVKIGVMHLNPLLGDF